MFQFLTAKTVSSRQQIAIQGVKDAVIELPHGQYRAILQVSAVNFELRSEEEQDAIIATYESFLNSIGFPVQILIRTREIDIEKYLTDLMQLRESENESIYKDQLLYYSDFVRSLITTNKILTRHFYVIVPYSLKETADNDLMKEQLQLRLDIISKGMSRIGMQTRRLLDLELLDLFYSFYSPEQAKRQPLTKQALSLLHTSLIQKEASRG